MVDDSEDYRRSYRSFLYSFKDRYDYSTLNSSLVENKLSLGGFAAGLYRDLFNQYSYWEVETLKPFYVETEKIEHAYAVSDKEDNYRNKYADILESIEYLSKHYDVHERFKTFYILKDKIKDVDQLTREVKCLDLIIDAFDNTLLRDSEVLVELRNIYRKQNSKLMSSTDRVDEMYKKNWYERIYRIREKISGT
jgi:hypothetical protein